MGSVVAGYGPISTAYEISVSRPGIKPVSPALQGGFLITGPPGKSPYYFKNMYLYPGVTGDAELGTCPGEGNDNSLQYSSLENSMDKGAWWGPVHGFAKSQTLLSNYYFQLIALFILKYVFVSKCSETFENVAVFEY